MCSDQGFSAGRPFWGAAVVMLFLCSCGPQESNYYLLWEGTKRNNFTPEASYAMGQWINDNSSRGTPSVDLQSIKTELIQKYRDARSVRNAFPKLVQSYSPPSSAGQRPQIRLNDVQVYAVHRNIDDFHEARLHQRLEDLKELLSKPVRFRVDWRRNSLESLPWEEANVLREQFNTDRNSNFTVRIQAPDMSELERALRFAEYARYILSEGMASNRLYEEGRYRAAYEKLQQIVDRQRSLTEDDLRALAFTPFMRALDRKLDRYADQSLNQQISELRKSVLKDAEEVVKAFDTPSEDLRAAERAIHRLENALCEHLARWRNDKRQKKMLQKSSAVFITLVQEAAALRAKMWRFTLRRMGDQDHYWKAYKMARTLHEKARQLDIEAAGAYEWIENRGEHQGNRLKDLMIKGISAGYMDNLPRACDFYTQKGAREINSRLMHGLAAALCTTLDEIVQYGKQHNWLNRPYPAELTKAWEKRDAWQQHLQNAEERRLFILEFTPERLGPTFVTDLRNTFRQALNDADELNLTLAKRDADPRPRDYVIDHGNVASFEVEEPTPTRTTRSVMRFGNVQEVPNPDYKKSRSNNEDADSVPQKIWRGFNLQHVVHVETHQLVASVRLTFDLVRGDREIPFDINQFYRRRFMQEQHHPINDTKQIGDAVYSQKKPDEDPKLTTRIDQIPSHLEMEDWARRETLELVKHELLRHAAARPLQVAEQAREFAAKKKAREAANAWGRCLEMVRRRNPNPEELQKQLEKTEASYFQEQLEADLKVEKQLLKLKNTAREETLNAVAEYLSENIDP